MGSAGPKLDGATVEGAGHEAFTQELQVPYLGPDATWSVVAAPDSPAEVMAGPQASFRA